ncbi:WYL domain-containing protein [Desulforamulus reducens]|nr:WYL domain-containing protein [Desulforamulus reducens]
MEWIICPLGLSAEVLEPAWLREEMIGIAKQWEEIYR